MTTPSRAAGSALGAGVLVLLVLLAQRAGLPLDLFELALGGLAVAVVCGFAAGLCGGEDRRYASAGLGLCLLPALVLALELARP